MTTQISPQRKALQKAIDDFNSAIAEIERGGAKVQGKEAISRLVLTGGPTVPKAAPDRDWET